MLGAYRVRKEVSIGQYVFIFFVFFFIWLFALPAMAPSYGALPPMAPPVQVIDVTSVYLGVLVVCTAARVPCRTRCAAAGVCATES